MIVLSFGCMSLILAPSPRVVSSHSNLTPRKDGPDYYMADYMEHQTMIDPDTLPWALQSCKIHMPELDIGDDETTIVLEYFDVPAKSGKCDTPFSLSIYLNNDEYRESEPSACIEDFGMDTATRIRDFLDYAIKRQQSA